MKHFRGALEQAQEYGLEDVLGIGCVAGDAVGGPEDHAGVGVENGFEIAGGMSPVFGLRWFDGLD